MGIFLICISHKCAPAEIRERFAFAEEKIKPFLLQLAGQETVEEAVLLTTCNRTELYCSSGGGETAVFAAMQAALTEEADVREIQNISDYFLRYRDKKAVHHLFSVAAGLDSMVLGEDQILGQVKHAFALAQEAGTCHGTFQTLFRMAVTAAKKVKTDTMLSKIPVSTASIAVKQIQEEFPAIGGKNLLVIGASGKIGSILLKDILDVGEVAVYATVRHRLPGHLNSRQRERVRVIPYEERYAYLDKMDVVVSTTASPHYTITAGHYREACLTAKKRVFFDMAVPSDIESDIGKEDGVVLYTMDDMERLARKNNEKKEKCLPDARQILLEYEQAFHKDRLYAENRDMTGDVLEKLSAEAGTVREFWQKLLFGIKEMGTDEEFETFLRLLERLRQT